MRHLWLHGFASGPTSSKGQFVKQRLWERGIELEIPDLNEPAFFDLTVTRMLQRLDALAGAAGGVVLFGSSLGGFTAATWAALHPDRARALVLLAPAFELGFKVVATGGTADFLHKHGIEAQRVNKVLEGRPHIVDLMKDGKVQLVFNTVDGAGALTDSYTLRRAALMHKIAYYTTVAGAKASVEGIAALSEGALDVAPLQSYFKTAF